jgi:hypothetical protein
MPKACIDPDVPARQPAELRSPYAAVFIPGVAKITLKTQFSPMTGLSLGGNPLQNKDLPYCRFGIQLVR